MLTGKTAQFQPAALLHSSYLEAWKRSTVRQSSASLSDSTLFSGVDVLFLVSGRMILVALPALL